MSIFTNPYTKTQVWTAQGATITYAMRQRSQAAGKAAAASLLPLVATGINAQYSRPLNQVFAINKTADGNMTKLILAGPPAGQLGIQSLMGPTTVLGKFLKEAGNACNVIDFVLKPFGSVQCSTDTNTETKFGLTITISGAAFAGLAVNLATDGAGMSRVDLPLSFTFTDLDWDDEN